ncbi:hypothetical protein HY624_02075 [Candidatus Uhrbacteria bacterium]|nr:hypothetical protein [Candidatus Uhrbacteria bacterium]
MYPNRKWRGMKFATYLERYGAAAVTVGTVLWLVGCLVALAVSVVRADNTRAEIVAYEFTYALVHGDEGSPAIGDPSPAQQLGASLHQAFPTPEGQRAVLEQLVAVQRSINGNNLGWIGAMRKNKEKVDAILSGSSYVPPHLVTWGEFGWSMIIRGLPLLWLILAFVSFMSLSDSLEKAGARFYDLPWEQSWMRWYAIATFPISTPFFCMSELQWRSHEIAAEAARVEKAKQEKERRRVQKQQEAERWRIAEEAARIEQERLAREAAALAEHQAAQAAIIAQVERNLEEVRQEHRMIACREQLLKVNKAREQLARQVAPPYDAHKMEQMFKLWRQHRGEVSYDVMLARQRNLPQKVAGLRLRLERLGRKTRKLHRRLSRAAERQSAACSTSDHEAQRAAGVSVYGLRRGIDQLGRRIESLQILLAEAVQAECTPEMPVAYVQSAERMNDELEHLLALPQVLGVSVEETTIEVWTKPVIIKVRNRFLDLGSYSILIRPILRRCKPEVYCVVATNHDRAHLYGNGAFCFGSRGEEIVKLMREREYLPVIILALEALHHVNPEHEETALKIYLEVTDGMVSTEATGGSAVSSAD